VNCAAVITAVHQRSQVFLLALSQRVAGTMRAAVAVALAAVAVAAWFDATTAAAAAAAGAMPAPLPGVVHEPMLDLDLATLEDTEFAPQGM
jgi:hypothetical protein